MSEEFTVELKDEYGTLELEVSCATLDPSTIWADKDEWIEREAKSIEDWNNMDEETRAAVIDIIDRSLQRMRDRIDVWAPASLTIEQGDYIDVKFRLIFSDMEREKSAQLELTQRRLEEAQEQVRRLTEDLESRQTV